ncbi:TonB-dependent receptor [Sphingomonas crusticola]|uniref:TonB-dependent receptor n=1 Tax=Sphingomonas crusticola TaxID=1697973 RepID=UPI000E26D0C3|nr:TonB-dependent receptor [Sphingomonas crusticola]
MFRAFSGELRADQAEFGKILKCGVSAMALCAVAAATPAMAQTGSVSGSGTAGSTTETSSGASAATSSTSSTGAAGTEAGEVVVTGIRQSLANAQNIKRNSDTVVDAITASDIGALPDRSVTEALQRVPGVAMNRFAGSNDPDHFSVEGSGVVVRGLNYVRSEFNGRDTFSAGVGGQSINFSDVPSELLGSVEVYKNLTAELIEGGLGGTVNLNTRKPFDNKGFHLGFDVENNYSDFSKKWSPTRSLLVSNTWETDAGTFGVLADVSYSRLRSRADGIQITNFQTRDNSSVNAANSTGVAICRNPLPGTTDTTGLPTAGGAAATNPLCGAANRPGADGLADPLGTAYAPLGGQFRTQDYDRKRRGAAVSAQWESNDRRALLTVQGLATKSTNDWGEHTFESAPDLAEYNTYPKGCVQNGNGPATNGNTTTRAECPVGTFQNYQYGADNVFESGFITLPGSGWRTASSGQATTTVPTGGIQQSLSRRQVHEVSKVQDLGVNFKFTPNDRWSFNLDGDYTHAEHNQLDMSVFGSTFADEEVDITGGTPSVVAHKPLTLAAGWATPNPAMAAATDSQYFANRDFQFWRAAMDHIEHSTGHEWAFKGDVRYNFEDGSFLKHVKFGARYADRDETVRYTAYNWGAISEVWSGAPVTFNQGDTSRSSLFNFNNFFRGDTGAPPAAYYYNGDLLKGYNSAATYFKSLNDIWHTTNGATSTNRWVPAAERAGVVAGTPYLPSEIQSVRDRDYNAYAMLSFGQNEPLFGGVRLEGNIGVRYVRSKVDSDGSIQIPTQTNLGVQDPFATRCAPSVPAGAPPGTPPTTPGGVCTLGATGYAQLQQFATGVNTPNLAHQKYDYFLPSLNLKFGLSRDLVLRFAASRALARPDLSNIRNFLTLGYDTASSALSATAGNPFLKPALAWQFDGTLEWYFARVGSLTLDAFYKSIDNFFYSSVTSRDITSNGVTQAVRVRGPANATKSGWIRGFEVAYQQTFDFLPGAFSGLGTSLNYTFLQSRGVPNSALNNGNPVTESTIPKGNLPLEQLSKHNFNATVFYEKGPISLRAAYNWRSRFLLTSSDVIFPFTPVFNDKTGQLDASIFLNLTKNVKIGVQGVNLTNETTKTLQQYTVDGRLAPRSYFVNDRRYSFILRGNW